MDTKRTRKALKHPRFGAQFAQALIECSGPAAKINDRICFKASARLVPQSEGIKADVTAVDPPREGCEESLLETLTKMRSDRIVFVSCNPATLTRDLKFLEKDGYKALEVQPVDMLPRQEYWPT